MPVKSWRSRGATEEVVIDWAENMNPNTAKTYVFYFLDFVNWGREKGYWNSAEEMLKEVKEKPYDDRYETLDTILKHIKSLTTGSADRKNRFFAIRSFFKYYRVDLPNPSKQEKDVAFKPSERDEKREIELEDTPLKLEEVRTIINNAPTLAYQAAMMVCFQGAMGRSEYNMFNEYVWEKIVDDLDSEEPVKVPLIRKKISGQNLHRFYTFIGKDAKELLKRWLDNRPDVDDNHLFLTYNKTKREYVPITGELLQNMINKVAKRSGLIKPNGLNAYHVKLHEFRDVFKSYCNIQGVSDKVSEFFLGHVVDKRNYDKAHKYDVGKFRDEYKKVEPILNILSPEESKENKQEVKKEILQDIVKNMFGKDVNIEIAKLRDQHPEASDEELIAKVMRTEMQALQQSNREYKQIDENDLVKYLNDGWEIVQQLNGSNQVIVSKVKL